jgi:hypothetical protein
MHVRFILAILCAAITTLAVGADKVPNPQAPPPAPWWLARPWHTEPQLLAWAAKYPQLVTLEKLPTHGGRTAYAVTVTDRRTPGTKSALLFSQPHAHEPATTAGMMDVLAQLLDGVHLDGTPSDLPRREWLTRTVLSFIPDGNPDGRARAPEDWWDGTHSNQEFIDWAFGRQADGRRCPRVGRWSLRDQQPAWIGFAYEQINEHEFVEPNRDLDSSYFRLVRRMHQQRAYVAQADLHQTEFERSPHNAMIILPCVQRELPEALRQTNSRLGLAVVDAWRRTAGASPIEKVEPLNYGEDQLRYFRRCWDELYRTQANTTFEIQNNNRRTPPKKQMELIEVGIRAVVQFFLTPRVDGSR